MTSVTELLRDGRFTRADLDATPEDDGRRYELVDGLLVVSPAPGLRHQRSVGRLFRLLTDACPEGFEVLVGPFDVVLSEWTVLEPDLVVGRRDDFAERGIERPLLVVEVRSPSTGRYDALVKRRLYEEAGVPSYWLVDPMAATVTVLELDAGRYAERAVAGPDGELVVERPFPVSLRPAALQ